VNTPTTGSSPSATSVSDDHRLALTRIADALRARRVTAGHWEGHLSSSALATATAVTALSTAAARGLVIPDWERVVARGIAWLFATRNEDGGWGDTPDSISNISTTVLVWAALSYGQTTGAREAAASAAAWIARAAGSDAPEALAAALASRYGKDRTFSVPILTMCAITGRLGAGERAWHLIPQLPFELSTVPRRLFGALRLPVVSYALPALISMGLARHRRGAAIPLLTAVRELAAPKALRVLETLQPENGGFLEAVPLTAFVTMSLVVAGEVAHPVARRGVDFLAHAVREDGSWPIDSNLATWATTLAVNAGAYETLSILLSPAEQDAVRTFLLRQQWTQVHPYTGAAPGGWAWTDLPGGVPDADDTAGAVLALSRLGRERTDVRASAAAGIAWLLDQQNRDGGIPTFCKGWGTLPFDRSSSDLTAHALRAWGAWVDDVDERLRVRIRGGTDRAVAFLASSQRAGGAFVPLWFGNQREQNEENPVFGTARVIKGLLQVTGAAREKATVIAAGARRYLLEAQGDDGGWGGATGLPATIEETAVSVAALSEFPTDEACVKACAAGVDWLQSATHAFSVFSPSPLGLYFARLWYSEELYPLLLTIDAIGAVAALPREPDVRGEELVGEPPNFSGSGTTRRAPASSAASSSPRVQPRGPRRNSASAAGSSTCTPR
jgi:squalene-hopene/tetraprenyl-beta-curcumene cyclase